MYLFKDWMTAMGWAHPELFHILPCAYNFQVSCVQSYNFQVSWVQSYNFQVSCVQSYNFQVSCASNLCSNQPMLPFSHSHQLVLFIKASESDVSHFST